MAIGDLLAAGAAGQQQVDPSMGMALPAAGVAAGPKTQQEFESNKAGWRGIFQKLKDPNVRAALLQTGLGLMKSPGYGQSGWDVASNALAHGAGTLQALREAERAKKIQDENRAIAESQRKIENTQKNRQLATGEANTTLYGEQVRSQASTARADDARADLALTETQRANKAQEEIARMRAQADLTRARAFSSGGGRTAADIVKIQNLAKQYMLPPEQGGKGLDETNAMAEATKLIELQGKSKSPSEMVQEILKTQITSYSNSIEGMRSPPTPEMMKKWRDDAINQVIELNRLDAAQRGPVAPNPQYPGQPTGVVQRTPGGPAADPATSSKVEALKSRGIPLDQIKQALINEGKNPADYGL